MPGFTKDDPLFLPHTSEAKTRANRENAQKSTGPKTAQGKRNSSRNAVKHGILAVGVVSQREDHSPFNRLVDQLCDDFAPVGILECIAVERIAVCLWRLHRALRYEGLAVDAITFPDLERTLRYESHVDRELKQAMQDLERLQSGRKARELENRNASPAQADGVPEGE